MSDTQDPSAMVAHIEAERLASEAHLNIGLPARLKALATSLRRHKKLITVGEFDDITKAATTITTLAARVAELQAEVERLRDDARSAVVNTPETADFMAGVPLEAAHQRDRWGSSHDAGKSPFDWFWLIGYLAQKAADAHVRGDAAKAQHHTISTAAALANWHAAIAGVDTSMRPGIAEPALEAKP